MIDWLDHLPIFSNPLKKEHKEQENQTKSKPNQREGKKEKTNENKYIKTRNQFDVLGDETPETTEEETQHVHCLPILSTNCLILLSLLLSLNGG